MTSRGMTLIEVLVAAMIAAVCILALVSMWTFSVNVTRKTEELSSAYNLSRQVLEQVKTMGFAIAPEGTHNLYFDRWGGSEDGTANRDKHYFHVTVIIASDRLATPSGGGVERAPQPAGDALRTVTVVVRRLSDNQILHRDGTYFARSGI